MNQASGQRQASNWVQRAQTRGLLNRLLWPVSLLYRMLIATRRWMYAVGLFKVHQLDVPVVVVGNVVVGGAGKTPCTIALVNHLKEKGWHPGVVSRGHGRKTSEVTHVLGDTPASQAGDEPLLIHKRTAVPVCVAARRVDAAQALLAAHPQVDVLVCDDGLQHLALGRRLAIAVFDDRGTGNGWLLPAGLLREPWPSAHRAPFRPDLLLQQNQEGSPTFTTVATAGLPMFHATRRLAPHAIGPHGATIELSMLRGKPIVAAAGIARPQVFFDMLRGAGLSLAREVALPDHADTDAYAALLQDTQFPLVCTEKDATKLFALLSAGSTLKAWAVPLELAPDPAFFAAVDARLTARRPVR